MARLCAERGTEGVSLADVLKLTEIDREDFERHFGSKEAWVVATWTRSWGTR